MSSKNSELAKILFMALMILGGWLLYSETSLLIGFILVVGALAGIAVLARRENSLPLERGEREVWEMSGRKASVPIFSGQLCMAYSLG